MAGRIETLDQYLKQFRDLILKLAPLAQQEMLNYRTLETQHSQLREQNTALAQQAAEAEEKIRKSVETADMIVEVARNEEKAVKANIMALHTKAQVKFKTLEKKLDEADRSVIRKNLKELEETVA